MGITAKFLVFTDMHVDIMPDAVARTQVLLEEAKRQKVDFIIQLGDFMYPDSAFLLRHAPQSIALSSQHAWFVCDRDDEKLTILRMIESSGIPVYSVLGNHDMDACSKETACRYYGLPHPHYSFDAGGLRFIVLDTNFIKADGRYIDFDHCNYRYHTQDENTWLSPDQLYFIEQTVTSSPLPCILLSHASLGDRKLSIHNREELHSLLEKLNTPQRKVILALNGHSHVDGLCVRKGIPMMNINSASNIWIGHRYDAIRYSETISRYYPHLKGCAPYWDALFAIFEIDGTSIRVTGRDSLYVGPSPYELGVTPDASAHPITPCIKNRLISMDATEDCDHV